jgi:hypothetical protein
MEEKVMKKSYQPVVQLFGIVFLLTLLLTPVVSAQPAMQYLNIIGTAFTPLGSTQTYDSAGGCIWSTGGTDNFNFPVLLPRGSLIKYLEFIYFDTLVAPLQTLNLVKFDPLADPSTSTILTSLLPNAHTGKAKRISAELNITVETDCTVDSKCFYQLFWGTFAPDNRTRLCGARIHYIPPFGALALPLIQRN